MRASRSCDPELYRKVKEAVTMQQVAEHYGLKMDRKGLCLCPFHQDKTPSLKIYPDGKGFYCFSCGAGGDQIGFVAMHDNLRNYEAAKQLAMDFCVPVDEPVTYREKREAEKQQKRRHELAKFVKRSKMYLTVYRGLLCEAIRERNSHFLEALGGLTYIEYLLDCLEQCPEELFADKKAVRRIGEIEGRIIDWYIRIEPDGSISR